MTQFIWRGGGRLPKKFSLVLHISHKWPGASGLAPVKKVTRYLTGATSFMMVVDEIFNKCQVIWQGCVAAPHSNAMDSGRGTLHTYWLWYRALAHTRAVHLPLILGGIRTSVKCMFLGPHESTSKTASWSVQSYFYSSRLYLTRRRIDK